MLNGSNKRHLTEYSSYEVFAVPSIYHLSSLINRGWLSLWLAIIVFSAGLPLTLVGFIQGMLTMGICGSLLLMIWSYAIVIVTLHGRTFNAKNLINMHTVENNFQAMSSLDQKKYSKFLKRAYVIIGGGKASNQELMDINDLFKTCAQEHPDSLPSELKNELYIRKETAKWMKGLG